jgi:uncharacterized protein YceK
LKSINIVASIFLIVSFLGCSTIETQRISNNNYDEVEQKYIPSESDCILSTPNIYSGSVSAFEKIFFPFMCPCGGESGLAAIAYYPLFLPVLIIDLPISAVADTVILPYTAYKQIKFGNIETGCLYKEKNKPLTFDPSKIFKTNRPHTEQHHIEEGEVKPSKIFKTKKPHTEEKIK